MIEFKRMENYSKYKIYNNGDVYSFHRNKKLKPRTTNKGYVYYDLYDDNKKVKRFTAHRLVGFLFVDGFKDGLWINHKDFNRSNNNYQNLEWVTPSENNIHRYKTKKYPCGENNCRSKLKTDKVIQIKKLFSAGLKCATISRFLNIKYSTVNGIINGYTWNHVVINE